MGQAPRLALLGTILALFSCAALAQHPESTPVAFAIEQQPMLKALNAWAQQAKLQLIWPAGNEAAQQLSPRVVGRFPPREALQMLLKGSALEATMVDAQTVEIRPVAQADTKRITWDKENETRPPLQVAQASNAMQKAVAPSSEPVPQDSKNPSGKIIDEVVVTGSHIRGLNNSTSPVTVLDRSYIESTGLSTTSALIESLPQNFALTSQSGVLVPGVSQSSVQGSSINLRGLGEGTTLVLLNGRRMASGFIGSAVDISALPLSLIDRVEVLTDGASAIYGSDAVGGVVNFILRRDLNGSETQLRGGWADGVDEYRASQGLGTSWDSGNVLFSFEYYKRSLLRANERDFTPGTPGIGSLLPADKNYSGMLSGRQNLTDDVAIFADALYTRRDSYNEGGRVILNERVSTTNPQVTTALGLDWAFAKEWAAEISASYARNDLDQVQRSTDLGEYRVGAVFDVKTAEVKTDGTLFELAGGAVRAAVGIDWRLEELSSHTQRTGAPIVGVKADQTVRSAFAEVSVPIVGTNNAMSGIRRLELSLAGRYDDYSNFGSSLDPHVGLMWEPALGLRLRAAYGTSYKAPKLTDYDTRFNDANAVYFTDPGVPGGVSHQLWISGVGAGEYKAQESESLSFGVEFTPQSTPDLTLGVNYYRIKYRDRISNPPSSPDLLLNPASYGQLIIRNPTAAQVNEYIAFGNLGYGLTTYDPDFNVPDPNFTPGSVDVILDSRRRNLSSLDTSGLDASIKYSFRAGGSEFQLGLNGTYIVELEQRATDTSAPVDLVDTFYNPPQVRLRGNAGWHYQPWAATLFVNHTGAYTDNRTLTPVEVSSYTTVDARLAYNIGERVKSGFWSGVTLAFSAQNLLDEDPPQTAIVLAIRDMGFDPTNSNPMGRLVGLQLSKVW